MLSWLASGHFCLDDGHSQVKFTTNDRGSRLPILIPDVTREADNAARFARDVLGEEVQDELRKLITDLKKRLKP
jgi:hypothetical protein